MATIVMTRTNSRQQVKTRNTEIASAKEKERGREEKTEREREKTLPTKKQQLVLSLDGNVNAKKSLLAFVKKMVKKI